MTSSPDRDQTPSQLLAASLTRPLTSDEQARVDAWMAGSAAAREEAARTREAWMALGLAADDPTVREMRRAARQRAGLEHASVGRPARRPLIAGLGLAAAAIVGIAVLGVRPVERAYAAPAHAAAHLTLVDGSRVTLSPGGRLTTRFTRGGRAVSLNNGDAFFEVSHDRTRPFTVAASQRTLTVLGTRFNVAAGHRFTVSLVEGSLRVSQPGEPSMVLKPGERYVATKAIGGEVRDGDVTSDAAWIGGRVVLSGASLGEAAERLSRASGRQVRLTDPALAELRLSGSLRIDRMDDLRAALEALLPVRASVTDGGDLIVSPIRRSSRHG